MRKGWRRWRFDQMAVNVNDRVDDPRTAGVDRYVGLEHLDSNSLKIQRWGTPHDVEATKLRFRAGDIIFGKRRAYQRKLAVADFDGICSAHAMVLRARPDVVLPEFLPFFMQSDIFMERAQTISVGSLSPTINWRSLAAEEFALPPVEEQRRFSISLTSAADLMNELVAAESAAHTVLSALLHEEFERTISTATLQSFCKPIVRGIDSPGPNIPDGVPYVRIAEMTGAEGIVVERLLRTTKEKAAAHPESALLAGDFVVALRGVVGLPVRVPSSAAGANLSRGTARVSVLDTHSSEYVFWALNSPRVKREVLRFATGWKGEDLREITLGALRELRIPAPPREEEDVIAFRIGAAAEAVRLLQHRIQDTRRLFDQFLISSLNGGT